MTRFSFCKHHMERRAFTLLELLVSVALLAVIILGLLAMFTQVQRAWKSSITQSDVMEGGRATMALVMRDLQDMVALAQTSGTNLEVIDMVVNSALPLDQADGGFKDNFLQQLSFIRRVGDTWTGVAYRITNAAWGVGTLYRLEVTTPNPASPLSAYYNHPNNLELVSEFARLSVLGQNPPSNTNYAFTDFGRVVDGVVNFTVTAFDANGVLMNNLTNPRISTNEIICTNLSTDGVLTAQILPAYIEVELSVLEPALRDRFNARADLDATPNKQTARDFLRKKAGQVHIFRQRVPIRPAATSVGPLLPGS